VTVAAADAELALVEACARVGSGCRERSGPGGEVMLDFWVPASSACPVALEEHLAVCGIAAGVEAQPEGDEWRTAMLSFHRPVEVAGLLLVRPPWEAPRPPLLDVEIDPGMAFGTAQHATTRNCLEMLARLPIGGAVLDAGCGTGVLSIAARRLGFDDVFAFDADPLAVDATIANARRNGVALTVARRTIGADRLPAAEVLLANLTGSVLCALAPALPSPAPRRVVASGLRPEEVAGVHAAFAAIGVGPVREVRDEGWSTLLMERA
jgi:ribosomal protein L11 methyltransferase